MISLNSRISFGPLNDRITLHRAAVLTETYDHETIHQSSPGHFRKRRCFNPTVGSSKKMTSNSYYPDLEEASESEESDVSTDKEFSLLCSVVQHHIWNIDEWSDVNESPEYAEEIDNYLRELEHKYKPDPYYISKQKTVTEYVRSVALNWLFMVCEELGLRKATFQLTVSYIDRFLSKICMPKKHMQLLTITSLFIAIKIEEGPKFALARRLVWLTDNAYTVEQLLKMENMILTKLDHEMNSTVISSFLDRFLKASNGDLKECYFTEYLCNRSLIHGGKFLHYPPSLMGAAAVGLSRAVNNPGQSVWTPTLSHYTKYDFLDIEECAADMLQLFTKEYVQFNYLETCELAFDAVWNKYNHPQYQYVLQRKPILSIS